MSKQANNIPIALTIAGSDSGGGAGIQADLKAFSANGVYGASAITAVTAQNTQMVSAIHPVPTEVVVAQIKAVIDDLDVKAIKIGMLFSAELVSAVASAVSAYKGWLVLDPVMIAKSGDALLQKEAIDALKSELIPRVDLLTPNYPEAATLLDLPTDTDFNKINTSNYTDGLLSLGAEHVLLKSGHGTEQVCTDILLSKNAPNLSLSAKRIDTQNTHGTGCTYSSTIAAMLASGLNMQEAVKRAHQYLHQAITHADDINIGSGHGPVHHFYELWKPNE